MSEWLIKNGLFVTMNDAQPIVRGFLHVIDDRIAYIGEQEPQVSEGTEIVGGEGLVFMPGLINTHGHTPMTLLRGFADDMVLQTWLQDKIWPLEAKFDDNSAHWGSALAQLEMLKTGTTAFVDMYDRTHIIAGVVEQSGLRGVLARGVIGFGSPEELDAKFNEAYNFARDWNGKADGRIATMLSPHAPYTCGPAFIERFVQASHELNVPIHTHMSETAAEVEQNVRDYGARPVEHLDKLGVFGRPTLLAHAVHLNDEEIALLAERGVAISHNAASNLKLASGVARVPDLLRAGVTVSLGTDGAASNNNLSTFDEIRLAGLIHKGVSGDPTAVPAIEALKLGTIYGARAIWQESSIGSLEAGKKADIIALDLNKPHFFPLTDIISHLVYSGSGSDVVHVWIDGKQTVRKGECLTLDEERIYREAQAAFERLL
ncbi:5-methylthioadenosine/S-adenosylhomocysteine deaminase [Paenibacillus sp. CCS19]|uniref:amidohydrolase n=1 Tax=Paenibacillus sp. CCS19 TaxID=3158387 RepID=UPI002562D908|nr:amidohydrolase [Paenibacillus cellulosilyticus]GMK42457.1 5-methylthioadenosine/S-adenosylhomocysteine deaminase [Paenibacillus cellulosilyticus]